MKLKMISICMLFLVIHLSCKKEELFDVVNSGKSDVPMLSKVLIDNQPYNEFLYNSLKTISEEKSNFDYKLHHYNDKSQLISTDFYSNVNILSSDPTVFETALTRKEWVTPDNGNKDGTMKYEYNDIGQLIRTIFTRPSSTSSETSEFNYDANKRINKQTLYWENNVIGYIEYSYDGKGNLIRENLFNVTSAGNAELSTTTQYEFDNQQNPYRSFSSLGMPGIYTNRNNIVKETSTILPVTGQGTVKIAVISNSYEYNANGYPTGKNGNVVYLYK